MKEAKEGQLPTEGVRELETAWCGGLFPGSFRVPSDEQVVEHDADSS